MTALNSSKNSLIIPEASPVIPPNIQALIDKILKVFEQGQERMQQSAIQEKKIMFWETGRLIKEDLPGTVAATGSLSGSASLSPSLAGNSMSNTGWCSNGGNGVNVFPNYSGSISGTLSGGTTALTTKQYSGVLANATTLTFDGPCEWQVVIFY